MEGISWESVSEWLIRTMDWLTCRSELFFIRTYSQIIPLMQKAIPFESQMK